jgi:hypothetical protein
MTMQKRVTFYAPDDLIAWLHSESERLDVPEGSLCRRAIRLLAFGESQVSAQHKQTPLESYYRPAVLVAVKEKE